MSFLGRFRRKSAKKPITMTGNERGYGTGPWVDPYADTDSPGEAPPIRPINVRRCMLDRPATVVAGDNLSGRIVENDRVVAESPPCPVTRSMVINSLTKFEVIDEFGVDVGIGIVFGGPNK